MGGAGSRHPAPPRFSAPVQVGAGAGDVGPGRRVLGYGAEAGGGWFSGGVEPGLEEFGEVLSGQSFGHRLELFGGAVAVLAFGGPGLQDLEERGVADRTADLVQGERTPVVDGVVEKFVRPGVAWL